MSFSDDIVERAWRRSGGVCECTRENHVHTGGCKQRLDKDQRGNMDSSHGWEAHSVSGLYKSIASDCEILCGGCYKSVS